jgi:hypothetical protein
MVNYPLIFRGEEVRALRADTHEVQVITARWKLVDHGTRGMFFYCKVELGDDHDVSPSRNSVSALEGKCKQLLQMEGIYKSPSTQLCRLDKDKDLDVLCVELPAGTNPVATQKALDRALQASPLRPADSVGPLAPAFTP